MIINRQQSCKRSSTGNSATTKITHASTHPGTADRSLHVSMYDPWPQRTHQHEEEGLVVGVPDAVVDARAVMI